MNSINNNTEPLLNVQGIHKAFDKQVVLKNVTFSVNAGERVALMGPSGSGKSTLLNLLSGIDRPDEGKIMLGSTDLANASENELATVRRHDVSTVFQFFHLLPTLTAAENIDISMQIAGIEENERKNRISELLDAVNLTSHAKAFPDTLSGGESQRIAIARALAHRPKLILADEPTGSLDLKNAKDIFELLNIQRKPNRLIIFATHNRFFANKADCLLEMSDGNIKPINV